MTEDDLRSAAKEIAERWLGKSDGEFLHRAQAAQFSIINPSSGLVRRLDMLEFIIALVIIGAALYILQLLPIDATVKRIIQVIVVVILVIYALQLLLPMAGLG